MSEEKEIVFQTIQKFLKKPPAIIWGSGATVPYGLPTMSELNYKLQEKIAELGDPKYSSQSSEIRAIIWQAIYEAEQRFKQDIISGAVDSLNVVMRLIKGFWDVHPRVVNVITTNYDHVLELALGYHGIPFTDGFVGRDFSIFDSNLFDKETEIVNVIKVHGSLSWFKIGGSVRYLNTPECSNSAIIIPGKSKYQEAYNNPYRDLIQKSDQAIKKADCFLAVGFGFNDEHLTPKIKEKLKSGTPLVLVTKKITESCITEISVAQKYVLLEEIADQGNTLVKIKDGTNPPQDFIIEGDYWKLENFLEVVGND